MPASRRGWPSAWTRRCAPPRNCSTACWMSRAWTPARCRPRSATFDAGDAAARTRRTVRAGRGGARAGAARARLPRRCPCAAIAACCAARCRTSSPTRCATPAAAAYLLARAGACGDRVRLQVWDTGPGIPEHHLGQIFEEFHRFEQPFDWGERGLGLGLSICQRISRMLGHPLTVRSRGRPRQHVLDQRAARRSSRVRAGASGGLRRCMRPTIAGRPARAVRGQRPRNPRRHACPAARWQAIAITATTVDEALAHWRRTRRMSLLVDYHLHDRLDGLGMLDALRAAGDRPLPARC